MVEFVGVKYCPLMKSTGMTALSGMTVLVSSLGQPEFVSGPFHIWATVLDLGYCSHDPFRKIFGKS